MYLTNPTLCNQFPEKGVMCFESLLLLIEEYFGYDVMHHVSHAAVPFSASVKWHYNDGRIILSSDEGIKYGTIYRLPYISPEQRENSCPIVKKIRSSVLEYDRIAIHLFLVHEQHEEQLQAYNSSNVRADLSDLYACIRNLVNLSYSGAFLPQYIATSIRELDTFSTSIFQKLYDASSMEPWKESLCVLLLQLHNLSALLLSLVEDSSLSVDESILPECLVEVKDGRVSLIVFDSQLVITA